MVEVNKSPLVLADASSAVDVVVELVAVCDNYTAFPNRMEFPFHKLDIPLRDVRSDNCHHY